MTDEQNEICNVELTGITKVHAFAGTGKTTSLVGLAKRQIQSGNTGLYLAYNKTAQLDAQARFGSAAT